MVYNIVSSDYIKQKINDDFGPHDDFWTTSLNNWIGDAIQGIGTYSAMTKTAREVEVKFGRAKLPCNLEALYYVEANGRRLPITNSIYHAMSGERYEIGYGYTASPGYIHCPFNEGIITLYYASIPTHVDGDGVETPMVIDAFDYKEAVLWFCMMKMLSRGYEHPVHKFKDAKDMWEIHRDAARYHAKSMTSDELEVFGRMWKNKFAERTYQSSFNATNDLPTGGDAPISNTWYKKKNIFDDLRENGVNLDL